MLRSRASLSVDLNSSAAMSSCVWGSRPRNFQRIQYLVKESGEWRQNEIQIDYENLLKNFRRRTHGF